MNRRGRGEVARLIGAVRRDRASLLVTSALTAAVLGVVALPARAQLAPDTQPTGGVVVAGSARIAASPTTTTVAQSSARAAVNWQSFNVGSRAAVNFVQPSASAVTLNRVLAPDPSVIAGHIHANGGIVITNGSGVVFTQGAEINAASVVVSAAGITNRNFMAGRMQFDLPAKPGARIVNAGHITVKAAGLAALVAPQVANSGVITAKLGHVILAGGASAETLDLYGDGLVSLDVTPETHQVRLANGTKATALVTNTGTILASGGTVLLTARQTDGLVQDLVDAGGTIAANSLSAHAGTIAISGVGGSIRIPGTLLAVGSAPGTRGGAIALDATGTVALASGARIDASGAAGGGTVAIGTTLARARGGPGTTATLTASAVDVAPHARIAADATDNGNGGRVTVLSLGSTAMSGTITARGGPHGGNGGSVEISGENLSLSGGVDASAPLGINGSILLDPTNLTIVDSGADDGTDVTTSPVNGVAYGAGGANDTVSAGAIEGLSGNVTLQATNNLEIAAGISLGAGQALTLQAGNDLTIDAKDPATGSMVVVSAPGNIEIDAATSVATGGLNVQGTVMSTGGDLSASAGGITVGGALSASGGLTLNAGTGEISVPGSISGGSLSLTTTGAAIESGGTIDATTLTGTAGSGASLTGANTIGTLAAFDVTPSGTFNLADASPLTVSGKVSVPTTGFLAIEADSLAINGGTLSAPSGTVRLAPFTAMNAIALVGNGSAGAGTLAITKDDIGGVDAAVLQIGTTSGGPIVIGDATGPAVTIPLGLVLDLVSGSRVTENRALSVGELEGAVGSATLTAANSITTLGNFSDSSGGFSLTEDKAMPLLVSGLVSVPSGQTIALTADGIALGSGGSLSAPNGTVTLASATPGPTLDLTTGLGAA
ncbi:MAG: beta strand repeat-containing protein, partial [Acetobacteraceae bacterium]